MKKNLLFYFVALLSTSLFVLLQLIDPKIIGEQLESKTYDLRLRLRNLVKAQSPPRDIVIVAIDEKSIKEVGRWPWSRDVMAELVNSISDAKPKAIGIDILFTERESKVKDEELAEAIKKAGNVVLATAFFVPVEKEISVAPKDVPDFLWDSAFMEVKSQEGIPWKQFAVKPESVMPSLPEFSSAASLGHAYALPDMDGVLRWKIMYLNYGDDCYPQFSLQIARTALGITMKDMVLYAGSGIKLGDRFIPTDLSGRVLVNYWGREHSFHYKSAVDVMKNTAAAKDLRDKIVLIGTSALATYDQKVTPFSGNFPGVEENATVVANILRDNFNRKSPGTVEMIVILLTGIFLGLTLPRLRAILSASLAIGAVIFYVLLSCYLLIYQNLWINLLYPVTNMLTIFTIQTVIRFFHEERKAKEIRQMFSSYVSPKIVKELIENPDKARLGGERRVVTLLFSDIMGFTSLSERRQPEEVVSLLNEYFKEMADIIFRWDGTLDKFVGDEIMALWGAPLEQPNHAELALRCALNMSEKLNELQEMWRQRGSDTFDVGIGLNTGEVIIGNIGATGKKMDYTAIGDHVNLAARVEQLTRQYGTRILITENTYAHVEPLIKKGLLGHFELNELAKVKVKGKENEVKILGLKGLTQREVPPQADVVP
ncbi:MAG TPA: adenylate/guanylate cyclase domain-containing protein [Thermodesulfovibrionales bacterium]|nr:adenylate/guanylate cyclase domain-containing protein [Thermodesulfovibrionales bacterium]